MILFGLVFVAVLLAIVWRRLEQFAYLKAGEEYARRQALHREWKAGVPYDPRDDGIR